MQFNQLTDIVSWAQLRDALFTGRYLTIFIISAIVLTICYLWYLFARVNKKIRDGFIIFSTLINLAYLGWRIGFTLPTISILSFAFSLILVSAEVSGFIKSLTYRLLFSTPAKLKPATLANLGYYPTVDIIITTFNEPEMVVRRTVAGATQLNYPADKLNIYVCDDGTRDEIRTLCDEYKVNWITRETHEDAKAGNLNHCYINYAMSEFSVILDADMVPNSDFLEKTLGYFKDKQVAFVQTPQVFFNSDPFQRNLGLNEDISNEQDFFMREIQAHRQEYNALVFVGSGGVFRRKHLEKIGFIPTGNITEDLATSLLLQKEGYKSRFTNETYAQGLSAETFSDYIRQRTRWAQGNIDIIKKWNPWRMKTLSFIQKAIITDGVLYWLYGIEKMIFILAPMVFVLLGIPIMVTDPIYLLLFWLPSFHINFLIMKVFYHKARTSGWSHVYETATAPHMAVAALRAIFFNKERRFKVTPKGHTHSRAQFVLTTVKPHLMLLGFSILALAVVIFKVTTATTISTIIIYVLNGGWLLYNLYAIIASIIICFEKPRVRKHDRIMMDMDIPIIIDGLSGYTGKLNNVSEGGCNISPKDLPAPKDFIGKKITLQIEDVDLDGTILSYISGKNAFAVQFDDVSKETYAKLVRFIFSSKTAGFGTLKERHALAAIVTQFFENIWGNFMKRLYRRRTHRKNIVKSSRKK